MNQERKLVQVHYRGTLDDDTEFDSSAGREPLEFVSGDGMVIPGFEKAVQEMEVGEKRTVNIPAAEAYGERVEEAIQRIPVDAIPDADKLPVGEYVYLQGPDGQPIQVLVAGVEEDEVLFDFNHQLAGKDLTFELELVSREDVEA